MVNYGYTNTQPPPHIPADNVSVSGSVLEAHLLTGMGAQQVPLAAPEDTAGKLQGCDLLSGRK